MSLRHLIATNRFVLENLLENRCLLDKIFVAATSRIKFRICAARKFGRGDKFFFHKIPQHTRSDLSPRCFFSCHHDVLLRLVVRPVHKEWFVATTFYGDMLPSVFRLELFTVKCAQNLKVHFSTIGRSIQSIVHSTLHVHRLSPNVHISQTHITFPYII